MLEVAGSHLFLLRPRRFGKSLFLSMLEYYYDIAYKSEFETLFGQLAIGQAPTPTRNSYQIVFMDFSGIDTDGDMMRFFNALAVSLKCICRLFAPLCLSR